jgi:hypothetical protein
MSVLGATGSSSETRARVRQLSVREMQRLCEWEREQGDSWEFVPGEDDELVPKSGARSLSARRIVRLNAATYPRK